MRATCSSPLDRFSVSAPAFVKVGISCWSTALGRILTISKVPAMACLVFVVVNMIRATTYLLVVGHDGVNQVVHEVLNRTSSEVLEEQIERLTGLLTHLLC